MSLKKDAWELTTVELGAGHGEPRRGSLPAIWSLATGSAEPRRTELLGSICERHGLADLATSPHAAAFLAAALTDAGGDTVEALRTVLAEAEPRGWVRVEREVSKFLLDHTARIHAANRGNAQQKRGMEERAAAVVERFDARVRERVERGVSPIHARELAYEELKAIKPRTLRKYRRLLRSART